ncbi:unnamed protein product [Ilex paraguariensis]|uniref:Replication protein A 70 kDa DNA-binding subunit B/D first OB fold domain-containing protein n=1 Tax=Ilex paraguariensis TaxID=185542 RepID=A0ABC8RDA4_9AQUA
MDSKVSKPVRREKAMLPPRRGQLTAKVFEELVESVMNMTTGGFGKKNQDSHGQSSDSSNLRGSGNGSDGKSHVRRELGQLKEFKLFVVHVLAWLGASVTPVMEITQVGKKFEVKVSDDEVPTTQFSTIDHLRKYDTNWLLMVKVLRRGTIVTFNNNMCSGELWKVILIDDEGARIQALMFTDAIAKFGDLFNEDKTYLISNGVVNSTNKKFSNVHKDIELSLTINTNVQEAETEILPYHKF